MKKLLLLGVLGLTILAGCSNNNHDTDNLAVERYLMTGDQVYSGDIIEIVGPEEFYDVDIQTGYFKKYTSQDLGISFKVLVAVLSGNEINGSTSKIEPFLNIIRSGDSIYFEYGSDYFKSIEVFTKDSTKSLKEEIEQRFLDKSNTLCYVSDISEYIGLQETNIETGYEYIGIRLDFDKLPTEKYQEMCAEFGCIESICAINGGSVSDDDGVSYYLSKEGSNVFLSVDGQQDPILKPENIEIID